MYTWDVKIEVQFLLNALDEIKKRENETVTKFNIRFQHMLHKIFDDMRPNDLVVLLCYMNAFDPHFGFALKEEEPSILEDANQKA